MTRDVALATLQTYADDLRRLGVKRAAVFGSVARGDHGEDSDLDILIELDEDAGLDVFAYVGIVDYMTSLFPGRVDVANRAGLKPHVRPSAERDAIYAF